MSPIPLGILAATGGVPPIPAITSDYELLETTTLSSNTSSISFSNLNSTYGSTYKHLQLRTSIKFTGGDVNIAARVNNDSGTNYDSYRLGSTGNVFGDAILTKDYGRVLYMRDTHDANEYPFGVIDILDPFNSSRNTTFRAIGGQTSSPITNLCSTLYRGTGTLDTLTFYLRRTQALSFGIDFETGSRFSLYGIKGA